MSRSAPRLDGRPVEPQIALDMLRRSMTVVPPLLVVSALVWGWAGAASSVYAVALVLGNLLVSATLLAWAARRSLALVTAVALFGYLGRMALIAAAVLAVKDQPWVALWPLSLTLVVTHLGLLFSEIPHVSASLAFPGLKPAHPRPTPVSTTEGA